MQAHEDELISLWFQTIIARDFTAQADFTSLILTRISDLSLFVNLPCQRDPISNVVELDQPELLALRPALLKGARDRPA